MTTDELVTAFQVPLTTFPSGLVIQRLLLATGAPGDTELASKRCLSLLEATELRAIFLAAYPEFKISDADLLNTASISDIKAVVLPYARVTTKAINELRSNFPDETLNLLKDYLVKESPLYFVVVNTFVVTSMVLIEAGEI